MGDRPLKYHLPVCRVVLKCKFVSVLAHQMNWPNSYFLSKIAETSEASKPRKALFSLQIAPWRCSRRYRANSTTALPIPYMRFSSGDKGRQGKLSAELSDQLLQAQYADAKLYEKAQQLFSATVKDYLDSGFTF